MQPNQQQSEQSNVPPAQNSGGSLGQPYQTPDYLHLDPVTGQTKISNNKNIISIVISFFVLGSIASAAVYWQSQQLTPEQKFYQAIDNYMQASYVTRTISTKLESPVEKTSVSTVVDTDFSTPTNPKSYIQRTYNQDLKGASPKGYNEESVVLNDAEYNILLKSGTPNVLTEGIKVNQWYRASIPASDLKYSLDNMESEQLLNSPQGVVPMGNINSAVRAQLISYIKQNDTYPITDVRQENNNNKKLTKYTVRIDCDKLNNLDEKLTKLLNIKHTFRISTYTAFNSLFFWVDDSSGAIIKMAYTNTDKPQSLQKTISISYPSLVNIPNPTDVKDLPS